jgi:two-component system, cell cycle sensor histidine kinase and response regulator CckA
MVGTCQDITHQKEAENQIATALAQLEAVLESVDAGILLMDEDNDTVLWANQNYGDFFGVPDIESIRGDPKLTQVLRQHVEANAVFDGSLNELRAVVRRDPNYRGPAGQIELVHPVPRLLQRFTTPVYNGQGQYVGRLWLYYDITKQRRLEEQVVRYQKVDSIGRLAAGMAHEFNNLLGAIMGFNSLALQKAPPPSEVNIYLQEVDKAVSRASGLVRQLLAFSRVQAFEPKVLNFNNLILESDRMLRRLVGTDVELVIVLAPDLAPVTADPGQLTQVLVNLVVNARDAMPQGGKLIVSTNNTHLNPKQALRVGVSGAGEYVVLTVADTGTGMTAEVKAHLFEPFFTTKEVGQGTGLGLSTCYGIITQSGGHIVVFSEPG